MRLLEHLVYPFRRPQRPLPRTAMGFFTDTSLCIGCKACEVACKQWNQIPADGFQWTGRSYDNTGALSATSWRHVVFNEQFPAADRSDFYTPPAQGVDLESLLNEREPGRWLMMSDVCKHCSAAPCQIACPTGAIVHNEFGAVYIQNDICNGCGYCIAACPFGGITRSSIDGHAHKCTLCYDRQRDGSIPACAKACPTESIQFGPIEELRERARGRVRELRARGQADAYLYGDEATASYPSLNAFFLLLDRPGMYGLPDAPELPQARLGSDYLRAAVGALLTIAIMIVSLTVRM